MKHLLLLFTVSLLTLIPSAFCQDEDNAPRDMIRRFDGTLGKNLGITLLMATREESDGHTRYDAAYHYHKNGLPIILVHDEDEAIERLEFNEMAGYDAQGNERISGRWSVIWDGKTIRGTWTAPDGKKKLPIELSEGYPAGSVPLEQLRLDFSNIEQFGVLRRGHERDLTFLRVPGKGSKALNARLARLARDAADPDGKVAPTPEAIAQHLREEVRGEIDWDGSYVMSESEDFMVRMNESGFLTVENLNFSFSGGAHGNYGSSFHVLEIATGSPLALADIVAPGFEARWAALGAAQLRKDGGLKPDAPLTEAGLFEDKLELTENWFLVPGGIGFNYPPYEIAAYARGAVEFVLPWKEIIGDLKPGTAVHAMAMKLAGKKAE